MGWIRLCFLQHAVLQHLDLSSEVWNDWPEIPRNYLTPGGETSGNHLPMLECS